MVVISLKEIRTLVAMTISIASKKVLATAFMSRGQFSRISSWYLPFTEWHLFVGVCFMFYSRKLARSKDAN